MVQTITERNESKCFTLRRLPTTFVKSANQVMVSRVSNLHTVFTQCLIKSLYFGQLEIAEVYPVMKKDPNKFTNYRRTELSSLFSYSNKIPAKMHNRASGYQEKM